jgi:hypothetical protein
VSPISFVASGDFAIYFLLMYFFARAKMQAQLDWVARKRLRVTSCAGVPWADAPSELGRVT